MSAGETISKIIVVTINIIFMLFGLAALILGIIFKVGAWSKVSDLLDVTEKTDVDIKGAGEALSISAIVFGAVIVVIAIVGCIGACCKVRCLLVLYAIVVLVILIAQIALVIFVGVKASDVKDKTKEALKDTLKKYHEDSNDKLSKAWSLVFHQFDCCGANNVSDFDNNATAMSFYASARPQGYRSIVDYKYPITCCKGFDFEDSKNNLSSNKTWDDNVKCLKYPNDNANQEGCVDGFVDFVVSKKWIFIGVGIAIFVVEILVIIMAFYICSRHD